MSYYRIDWDAINALPAAERMATLARINTDIRRVTGAERARMVHHAVAEHGTQKDAAAALGLGTARISQIIKENPMSNVTVTVTPVAPAELHRQYSGQSEPQPCYVEVDLRTRALGADWNGEIGNAIPFSVHHGFERRYPIPALTSTAANELLEKIRPLAERMCSDWREEWDGHNHKAILGEDAAAAEEEIEALCGDPADGWDRVWDSSELITVWDVDGATNGIEAEEYEITADTTDERLDEIEAQILEDLKGISDSDEVVLEGVTEYLIQLRDDAETGDDE